MSQQQHTQEPWRVELVNHALGDTGDYEGFVEIRAGDAKRPMIEIWDDSDEAEANARRIVACVNACAGIDTELLGIIADNDKTLAGVIAELEKQRDELLEVFQLVIAEMEHRDRNDGNAPGHGHDIPGVWDSDNGDLAGKPCAWCAVWKKAKELCAAIASVKEQA